ncbi:MAG: glycosyltransferase family 2 protein [Candidatus Cloacimonetes bacterium]|nr:glycosyltransferase family 2 protein [Candidatus Cloacimonadota bacterium]
MKLISVNITTYNRSHLLARCLDSVLSQSYKNIEVVIVDDCSTDETTQIVKSYSDKDDRVKYIKHELNKGNAGSRNTAMDHCSGFYVAFMDDDDEWIDIHKLQKQVDLFEGSTGKLGMICTSVRLMDQNKNTRDKLIVKPDNVKSMILKGNGYIYSPTVFTSKKVMDEVGGFDLTLPRGIDSDFYRVAIVKLNYDIIFMKDITTLIHEYGNDRITPTDSANAFCKDIIGNRICLEKFKDEFKVFWREKYYRKANILFRFCKNIIKFREKRLFIEMYKLLKS